VLEKFGLCWKFWLQKLDECLLAHACKIFAAGQYILPRFIKIPFLVAGNTICIFPVCKTRKHWAMNVSGNMLPCFDVLCNWLHPRSFQTKLYC